MKDPLLDDATGWDMVEPSASLVALADVLLQEHVALAGADKAILDAMHARAVIWSRERDARAALSAQMVTEEISRIERPAGSIREVAPRMRQEEDGAMKVLSLGCLRVLPRRVAPAAAPADPLFVFRAAERAVRFDADGPISEQRRRAG